jgi:hypothetical protein
MIPIPRIFFVLVGALLEDVENLVKSLYSEERSSRNELKSRVCSSAKTTARTCTAILCNSLCETFAA